MCLVSLVWRDRQVNQANRVSKVIPVTQVQQEKPAELDKVGLLANRELWGPPVFLANQGLRAKEGSPVFKVCREHLAQLEVQEVPVSQEKQVTLVSPAYKVHSVWLEYKEPRDREETLDQSECKGPPVPAGLQERKVVLVIPELQGHLEEVVPLVNSVYNKKF